MQKSDSLIRTLTSELVLDAYRQGYFPMAHGKHGPIQFFYYEPRGILPLDERFLVRRSLRQIINKKTFEIRFDSAFEEVIRACARHAEHSDEGIWLSEEMITIYCELHMRGIAHSVEAWSNPVHDSVEMGHGASLQGGLYGLALGSAFCGESMFSRAPYASQVALVALVEHLCESGFTLLDAQMESEHLQQFGMYTVSQGEYMEMLREGMGNLKSKF
jgi:leucyl/phenylalanyl-tRNA--protein transferase